MIKKIFIIILFLSQILYAQNGSSVIKNLQAKFNKISNLTADFSQDIIGSSGKKEMTIQGKFYYEKGNKFRVELKNILIVSNGKTLWNYNKKFNQVVIKKLNGDASNFMLQKFIFDYPKKSNVKLVKNNSLKKGYSVILTPLNKKFQFKSIQIWTNKTYTIKKIGIKNYNNVTINIQFDHIRLNSSLKDKLFNFKTPKGSKIIDFR